MMVRTDGGAGCGGNAWGSCMALSVQVTSARDSGEMMPPGTQSTRLSHRMRRMASRVPFVRTQIRQKGAAPCHWSAGPWPAVCVLGVCLRLLVPL